MEPLINVKKVNDDEMNHSWFEDRPVKW